MLRPPLPTDELSRLQALHDLKLLYTPAEERFDRITRVASRLFNVPIAMITLVAEQCQWFKSAQGLNLEQTSRDLSFCAHAILADEVLVIPDTHMDPRFADNPMVTGSPFVRFYAGRPLFSEEGYKMGTLCIVDQYPRQLNADDRTLLNDLGSWAEYELLSRRFNETQQELIAELSEARRQALIDPLTRLWNRRAIIDLLNREIERAQRHKHSFGIIMADIDHFKSINTHHGHLGGDEALRQVSQRMRSLLRSYDILGRYGGEEFLMIITETEVDKVIRIAEKIRRRLAKDSFNLNGQEQGITLSLGVAMFQAGGVDSANALISRADKALYEAKGQGRNRTETG